MVRCERGHALPIDCVKDECPVCKLMELKIRDGVLAVIMNKRVKELIKRCKGKTKEVIFLEMVVDILTTRGESNGKSKT